MEALLLKLVVDAYEGREVATFDVPGAYLHALIPDGKTILLKMRGVFVDIMCRINKEYTKHVLFEKGKKVLYVKVLRASYGCI